MISKDEGSRIGLKSVSVAIQILEIVARNNAPISLKMIAQRANISASKAHRYVQSLCVCEFLNQAQKSGSYDLGIAALRIGLSAVNRIDVVNRAGDGLQSFGELIEADVFLSVWSDLGPTVVRYERSRNPSLSMIGPGVAFPLFTSATGLIFAVYASPDVLRDVTDHAINENLDMLEGLGGEIEEKYTQAKENGYAYTSGTFLQGRECVAAPIFSMNNRIMAAVTYVSKCAGSGSPDSKKVNLLLKFCRSYSLSKSGYCDQQEDENVIAV